MAPHIYSQYMDPASSSSRPQFVIGTAAPGYRSSERERERERKRKRKRKRKREREIDRERETLRERNWGWLVRFPQNVRNVSAAAAIQGQTR
jgi:hypothetical protein